jgi:hypothetical protein
MRRRVALVIAVALSVLATCFSLTGSQENVCQTLAER